LKKNLVFITAAAALAGVAHAQAPATPAAAAPAPAPSIATASAAALLKVATIHVQNAIMSTKEGQKASQELQTKYMPRKQALDKKQTDIQGWQTQLRAGNATMSQAAKDKLSRDIDTSTKSLQRENEDFQAEVQDAEGKIMNELGQKLMEIMGKYTAESGIAIVVDVSNPQSPVLWADASIDITNEIVKRYDQAHPTAAAPAAPPAVPATKK
jgi:outer membrane protein